MEAQWVVMEDAVPINKINMDSWFFLILLSSGLTCLSASNATTVFAVSPSVGVTSSTRSVKASTTEPNKGETMSSKDLSPNSSLTSLSTTPTLSPPVILEPTYITTVNSSSSIINVTTRTEVAESNVTSPSPNATWLPDPGFTDAKTEAWDHNFSTAVTTPDTFTPSGTGKGLCFLSCLGIYLLFR